MHRKIVVVDGERAFVGGINYSADHLPTSAPRPSRTTRWKSRPDGGRDPPASCCAPSRSAASRREPLVRRRRPKLAPRRRAPPARPTRCSSRATTASHTNDIERHYRAAIRSAQAERIVIANAYFFPGYRLIKELRPRGAARRGRAAHPAGRARHADREDRRQHAVPPPAARRRAHLRILRPAAARQGGADGRRSGAPWARATSTR
jgi:phosphatidylserine/phosphatidylglycerophosphate/cardiolipin synthase-like enzyme